MTIQDEAQVGPEARISENSKRGTYDPWLPVRQA